MQEQPWITGSILSYTFYHAAELASSEDACFKYSRKLKRSIFIFSALHPCFSRCLWKLQHGAISMGRVYWPPLPDPMAGHRAFNEQIQCMVYVLLNIVNSAGASRASVMLYFDAFCSLIYCIFLLFVSR